MVKKMYKIYCTGMNLPQSQGIRHVHADNEKEALKIAKEKYPFCEVSIYG